MLHFVSLDFDFKNDVDKECRKEEFVEDFKRIDLLTYEKNIVPQSVNIYTFIVVLNCLPHVFT